MKFGEIIDKLPKQGIKRQYQTTYGTIIDSGAALLFVYWQDGIQVSTSLSMVDLQADDWEIEPLPEKKVEVTVTSIANAWCNAIKVDPDPLPSGTPRLHLFLYKLGLSDSDDEYIKAMYSTKQWEKMK